MNQFLITDVSIFTSRELLQEILEMHFAGGWRFVSSAVCQLESVASGGEVLRLIFEKVQ